ncbi:MAG: DUF4827 domain-containing protein [Bacteroides sp.]|nr:DUF4827 domain-containing protein [Bacteroides sp.]
MNIKCKHISILMIGLLAVVAGCSKSESYSELLRDEERAVNWYLASQRVETEVPADSVFEVGADAPFYRMDEDGTVYMQVVSEGDPDDKPATGDRVYFRFMRQNLKYMYEGIETKPEGNMDNFNVAIGATNFVMGNKVYPSTTQYGTGIQLPMTYLGYYSEVNLVLKSYSGFPENQSECTPYIMNIKYYKPEY